MKDSMLRRRESPKANVGCSEDTGPETLHTAQRESMVERQLRAHGIHDPKVLRAMAKLPRHRFVPSELAAGAYENTPLPIGGGWVLPEPQLAAVMTQALALQGTERVLEVGTGTGYHAALLGVLAKQVHSLEIARERVQNAQKLLDELGIENVSVVERDGSRGYLEAAPYDAILVGAAVTRVPDALVDQLVDGGRLVIPLGDRERQLLVLFVKRGLSLESETLAACRLAPLEEDDSPPPSLPWT